MKAKKEAFISSEIWNLTIAGAFQRSGIYASTATDKLKNQFRNTLQSLVHNIATDYKKNVAEHTHIANIKKIAAVVHPALAKGRLNFGVSQKILNLYLKYLWCMDKIPVPPHFPVDRITQGKLKYNKPVSWTQMKDETEYLKIIELAKKMATDNKFDSIAELELALFSRRRVTKNI